MITFKPITIEDKAEIESFTLPYAPANCDLAFANMFAGNSSSKPPGA